MTTAQSEFENNVWCIDRQNLRRRKGNEEEIDSADENNVECVRSFCEYIYDIVFEDADKVDYVKRRLSCCPPPVFIIIASLAQTIFFGVYFKDMPHVDENPYIYNPYKKEELSRFITYALMHTGTMHFIANISLQLLLGVPLEWVELKYFKMCLLYMSGVLAGSLSSSLFDPEQLLAGASAGVYAIIGGYTVTLILSWKKMPWRSIQAAIILVVAITSLSCNILGCSIGEEMNVVSLPAHVGGLMAGFLIGFATVAANKEMLNERRKIKFCLQVVCCAIYFIGCVIAITAIAHQKLAEKSHQKLAAAGVSDPLPWQQHNDL